MLRGGVCTGAGVIVHPKAVVQGHVPDNHAVMDTTVRKRRGIVTFADAKGIVVHRDDGVASSWQMKGGPTTSLVLLHVLFMVVFLLVVTNALVAVIGVVCYASTIAPVLAAYDAMEVSVLGVTKSMLVPMVVPGVFYFYGVVMSIQTLLLKWILVGRVRPDVAYEVNAWRVARYWFLEHLGTAAETSFVRLWYISNVGMNLWLKLLGSKIAWTSRVSTVENISPFYDLVEFGPHSFSAGSPHFMWKRMSLEGQPTVTFFRSKVGRQAFLGHNTILMQGAGLGKNCSSVDFAVIPSGFTVPDGASITGYGLKPFGAMRGLRRFGGDEQFTCKLFWHLFFVTLTAHYAGSLPLIFITLYVQFGPYAYAQSLTPLTACLFPGFVCAGFLGQSLVMYSFTAVHKWLLLGRLKDKAQYDPYGYTMVIWLLLFRMMIFGSGGLTAVFEGTPVVALMYRLMGAKIGRSCRLGMYGSAMTAPDHDLLEIGDGAVLDSNIYAHNMAGGMIRFEKITVGDFATVHLGAAGQPGVTLDPHTVIGPGSMLLAGFRYDNRTKGREQYYIGNPARKCSRGSLNSFRFKGDGVEVDRAPPTDEPPAITGAETEWRDCLTGLCPGSRNVSGSELKYRELDRESASRELTGRSSVAIDRGSTSIAIDRGSVEAGAMPPPTPPRLSVVAPSAPLRGFVLHGADVEAIRRGARRMGTSVPDQAGLGQLSQQLLHDWAYAAGPDRTWVTAS